MSPATRPSCPIVRKGLSDHHTVVVAYDLDAVIEIYRDRFGPAT
jgi:cobalamin biosynthesis protein CbiG